MPTLLATHGDAPLVDITAPTRSLSRVTASSDTSARELTLGALIGRRRELRRRAAVLRRMTAARDRRGAVAGTHIVGVGGIDKTTAEETASAAEPTTVRVFISYARDDAEHENRVREFWLFLRANGIDARLSLPTTERRQDWAPWMLRQVRQARFVLVVASPAYRKSAEGETLPGAGLGVQWEAALIREEVYADPQAAMNRFLPVVLPRCSTSDIPVWLGRDISTHYPISEYTVTGAERLLRLLTDQPPETTPALESKGWPPSDSFAGPQSKDPKESYDVFLSHSHQDRIAATSLAALGEVVKGMGEVAELALPRFGDEPLPSRITLSHVHAVEAVTQQLRDLTRQYGGQAGLFGAAARHYIRWMAVPATDAVQARLGSALAELHTEAGWACRDAGMEETGCFSRALRLADKAGDAYGIANAAWHAGMALTQRGHPDSGLKVLQLGQLTLAGFQPGKATPAMLRTGDPRVPTLAARLNRDCATAYAAMDDGPQARHWLAKAHDGWAPRDVFERAGMDLTTALIHIDLHQLDTAEQFATSAVRTYSNTHGRYRAMAELTLAELHVRAGEPRGLAMANSAIDAVAPLQSVRARQRLEPLIAAMEARPSSDQRELARKARTVAREWQSVP